MYRLDFMCIEPRADIVHRVTKRRSHRGLNVYAINSKRHIARLLSRGGERECARSLLFGGSPCLSAVSARSVVGDWEAYACSGHASIVTPRQNRCPCSAV